MPVDSTTSNAINNTLSTTAATKANDPANTIAQPNSTVSTTTPTTSVSSDGTVSTGVSKTGNNVVDSVISQPSTTSVSPASQTSVVQTAPPPAAAPNNPVAPPPPQQQNNQQAQSGQQPQGNSPTQQQSNNSPQPTARQAIAERRQEQQKMEEIKQGKEMSDNIKAATSMEQQRATQGLIISAMAYNPAFEAYKQSMLLDAAGYKNYSIYGNQRTVDNIGALRIFGNSDKLHNDMVYNQYNRGN
jgi:hypothetical protein